ncbi:hypothetical protein GpartN1_g1758.t1 [Galdieria partita]|uniref:Telomerase reverse transcriptase n=1 Tax=Galdieria partita TaxID=83374 RepID=A0A9C7UNZ1_9RHOD|nr:hypothetical protein GpartN1_g1758.t1 [Galdieria partita]
MALDIKTNTSLQRLRKEARKYFQHVYSVSSFLESIKQSSNQKLSSSKKRRQRRRKQSNQPYYTSLSSSSSSSSTLNNNRNPKFENLRRNLIICSRCSYPKTERTVDRCQYLTQAELVDLAVLKLTKSNSTNVLVYGRKTAHHYSSLSQQQTSNTIIKHLKSTPWQQLLSLVGDEIMLYWLTKCTLLLPVGRNQCLVQLCGEPITSSSYYQNDNIQSSKNCCKKLDNPMRQVTLASSHNDHWMAQSILYKGHHSPLQLRGESPILFPMLSPTMSGARILYQSIFQKFTLPNDSCSHESKHNLNMMKKKRICQHDRKILPLLLRVIRRCKKCKIVGILKRCCPLPSPALNVVSSKSHIGVKRKHNPLYDISIDKKVRLSSESCCKRLESKKSINSETSNDQQQQQRDLFARLVHGYSRPRHVTRFLTTLCSLIIPQQLWGTTRNRYIFHKWLAHLVRLRRDDELSIQQLMQAMDLYSLPWIASKNTSNPTQLQYRQRRFYQLIRWIVYSIVKPILTACFHSTDSEMFRKRILHYRIDVWKRIENLFHSSLHVDSYPFQRLRSHLHSEETSTFSQLRLLPKTSGLRKIQIPIQSCLQQNGKRMRLRRNNSHLNNQVLTNIQAIMEFERRKNPSLFASCVLSLDEIYFAWLKLKQKWKAVGKPPMYMAAVDISNAFDTIQLGLVTEKILPELFQEDEYVVLRFCATFRTHQNAKPILTKFEKVVCNDPLEESHFLLLCRNQIANKFKKAIITDQVSRIVLSREAILNVLRQRLMNNIVLFRNGLYLQRQGIPQGMTLSSRIASLYYGHFERQCLNPCLSTIEQDKEEVHSSLRLVDDFLYISSERKRILQFLHVMNNGSPSYGLCINPNKTRTYTGEEMMNQQNLQNKQTLRGNVTQLPWCGLLIHCQNLEITVDYSRYFDSSIYDTLSFKASESCMETLLHRAQQVFSMKFHAILIDGNINSQRTVVLNIFQASLLFAIKYFGQIFLFQKRSFDIQHWPPCVRIIVDTCCPSMIRLVRSRATCEVARSVDCRFPLSWSLIGDVCLFAFKCIAERLTKRKTKCSSWLSPVARELGVCFECRPLSYQTELQQYLVLQSPTLWKLANKL